MNGSVLLSSCLGHEGHFGPLKRIRKPKLCGDCLGRLITKCGECRDALPALQVIRLNCIREILQLFVLFCCECLRNPPHRQRLVSLAKATFQRTIDAGHKLSLSRRCRHGVNLYLHVFSTQGRRKMEHHSTVGSDMHLSL